MHEFDVRKGFNDITVMFCRRCGLSYMLMLRRGTSNKSVWEAMPFQDYQGKDIDPPCKPCQEGYSE